jgi:hypothetical protein
VHWNAGWSAGYPQLETQKVLCVADGNFDARFPRFVDRCGAEINEKRNGVSNKLRNRFLILTCHIYAIFVNISW